jgi:glycosyl transferase family 87
MQTRQTLARFWGATPTCSPAFSWERCRASALRTLSCGAVVWAMLGRVRKLPMIDLYPTYVAAHFANDGRWERIYHPSLWLHGGIDPLWDARARQLIGGTVYGTSFVYHPWYLNAARPLAAIVDYSGFQRGSLALNKLCIVFIGLGLARLLRWHTLPQQLLLTLLVGMASTTFSGIELGQNVLLALAFCLGAALAWQSGANLLVGGLFAALAWMCKPWCALLVVLCFLLRGLRAGVLTSAALAALMLVLPELVLPDVLMHDYRAMNLALTHTSLSGWSNLSVLSMFERAADPDWSQHLLDWFPRRSLLAPRVGALAVTLAVLGAGAVIWWRKRPGPEWTSAAWLAFMLIPLGICWDHYLIFAFPLACMASFSDKAPLALRALGLSLLAVLLALQLVVTGPLAEPSSALIADAPNLWLRAVPMALVAGGCLCALWFGAPSASRPARAWLNPYQQRLRAAWLYLGSAPRTFTLGIALGLSLGLPAMYLLLRA